mgnify:CR=1 FL=1
MSLSDKLALLASGIVVLVYLTYFIQMVKQKSTPNPATWSIWLIVSILNSITYVQVADTKYQGMISVTMTVFISLLFVYAYKKKKFTALKKVDKLALQLTGLIGLIWLVTGEEKVANILLQGVLLISFWPTIQGLRKEGAQESPAPWVLAVLAYVVLIMSMIVDFKGNYIALVYPIVNGIVGNGVVAILAVKKNN